MGGYKSTALMHTNLQILDIPYWKRSKGQTDIRSFHVLTGNW